MESQLPLGILKHLSDGSNYTPIDYSRFLYHSPVSSIHIIHTFLYTPSDDKIARLNYPSDLEFKSCFRRLRMTLLCVVECRTKRLTIIAAVMAHNCTRTLCAVGSKRL